MENSAFLVAKNYGFLFTENCGVLFTDYSYRFVTQELKLD
jgi:hypothetical protein